jgi:hypothetical protein
MKKKRDYFKRCKRCKHPIILHRRIYSDNMQINLVSPFAPKNKRNFHWLHTDGNYSARDCGAVRTGCECIKPIPNKRWELVNHPHNSGGER